MINNSHAGTSPSAACCAIGLLVISLIPYSEAFMFTALDGHAALARSVSLAGSKAMSSTSHLCIKASHDFSNCANRRPGTRQNSIATNRHIGIVRPRSTETTCYASDDDVEMDGLIGDGGETLEGGSRSGSASESESQAGAKAEKAAWEDDMREADDAQELTKQFYSAVATRWNTTVEGAMEVEKDLQFDRSIYDELRARRDFGFEQDLGLELKKRNMTQDAEETKEILEGLDALPGVSASTTVLPSVDLTPREVISSVLEALKNNNQPYVNHGVEVFVRFLSPTSAMHGVGLEGVARYLGESRNRALMHWDTLAYPRPLALTGLKKNKVFQPIKLKDTITGKWHPVSMYLTLNPRTNFWLIESMIMKGEL